MLILLVDSAPITRVCWYSACSAMSVPAAAGMSVPRAEKVSKIRAGMLELHSILSTGSLPTTSIPLASSPPLAQHAPLLTPAPPPQSQPAAQSLPPLASPSLPINPSTFADPSNIITLPYPASYSRRPSLRLKMGQLGSRLTLPFMGREGFTHLLEQLNTLT